MGFPHETHDLSDIIKKYTNWPKETKNFAFVIQYQDVEGNLRVSVLGTVSKLRSCRRAVVTTREVVVVFVWLRQGPLEVVVSVAKDYHTSETLTALLKEFIACISRS